MYLKIVEVVHFLKNNRTENNINNYVNIREIIDGKINNIDYTVNRF